MTDARAHLAVAGARTVEVVLGDGALGHSENATYARVIATVATADLPLSWLEQIAPFGRLVAPVRIAGSATRSIAFELDDGRWVSVDSQLCGFMPLRASAAADPRRILKITNNGLVTLHAHSGQDIELGALAGILDTAAHGF